MKLFYYLLLISLVSLSCASQKEDLAEEEPKTKSLDAAHHMLWFNIFYPSDELEEWLNRKLEGTVVDTYVPRNNDKDSVRIVLRRHKRIQLFPVGDSVDIKLPLHVEIHANREKKSGKIKTRNITGTMELYLNIKPDVNKEWNIISKSIVKEYKWTKQPVLQLGNTNLGIKFIVDHVLKKELDTITEMLDKVLEEKVNLKRGINRTWMNIQKPIRIVQKDSAKLFFRIDPKSVSGNIQLVKNGFLFQMAVATRSLVQVEVDDQMPPRPLPPFNSLRRMATDSNKLEVLASIPLTYINHELIHVIRGYSYKNPIMELKITDIFLRGSGDKIALDLNIAGTTEGKITIVGNPHYDIQSKVLLINDLDYQLETDHVLVNLLDKNFKENLLAYISKKISIDLGRYIDHLPDYLNETVNQGRSAEKFNLTFNDIELESIEHVVNENDLQILMKCRPKFDISLKKLPVRKKVRIR